MSRAQYHVTRVANGRDVFGHCTDYCDESGCSGSERWLGTKDACTVIEHGDLCAEDGAGVERGDVVEVQP